MKLADYLDKRGMKVYTFAEKIKVSVATAYKLLQIPAPVHWEMLLLVHEFTRGQVTPNDLLGVKRTKRQLEF